MPYIETWSFRFYDLNRSIYQAFIKLSNYGIDKTLFSLIVNTNTSKSSDMTSCTLSGLAGIVQNE